MNKLSKHLTIEEFEHSPTAIASGISNKMNDKQIACAKSLAENVFEPVRLYRGAPIKVNSGFRSAQLNKHIGGSKTSQHCKGEAIDLPLTANEFHYIKDNLVFDQLIWEFGDDNKPAWVHISFSKINRKQVLRAKKINQKTVYVGYL